MTVPYRLGIDIGTNSLGWCLLHLNEQNEPCGILDIGVRIFKDARHPKTRASLAAERRGARAMRRQRDRRLGRKHALMDSLLLHELMPADSAERKALEKLDPYELRARGLGEALHPYHLGRAIFHLAQRRGFRSNLKTDRKARNGVTKEAKDKLANALGAEYATLGDFLHRKGVGNVERKLNGKSLGVQKAVRFRPHIQGTKIEYDLYPTRSLYLAEFERLWTSQNELWKEKVASGEADKVPFTEEMRADIEKKIFHQRDLKPVPVGKCTLEPDDPQRRAPDALPIAQ